MGFNESWPVPAETWEEATDEHGNVTDDTLPPYIRTKENFERWQLCLKVLARHFGVSTHDGMVRIMARDLYASDIPTHEPLD